MSSSTSDSSSNSSLLNRITNCISHIQQKNLITEERFHAMRRYFVRSIGFSILLYCFFQTLMSIYYFFTLIINLIFHIFSNLLLRKFIQLILSKITNYDILFPLFWFISIVSYIIAKYSYKNIGMRLGKSFQSIKRYLFILIFIIFLLLQIIFILIPIAASIREQRRLTSVKRFSE